MCLPPKFSGPNPSQPPPPRAGHVRRPQPPHSGHSQAAMSPCHRSPPLASCHVAPPPSPRRGPPGPGSDPPGLVPAVPTSSACARAEPRSCRCLSCCCRWLLLTIAARSPAHHPRCWPRAVTPLCPLPALAFAAPRHPVASAAARLRQPLPRAHSRSPCSPQWTPAFLQPPTAPARVLLVGRARAQYHAAAPTLPLHPTTPPAPARLLCRATAPSHARCCPLQRPRPRLLAPDRAPAPRRSSG